MAKVVVSVINYNRVEMLKRCVESVLSTSGGVVFDLLVTDAGSTDGGREWIEERSKAGAFRALLDPMPSLGDRPVYSYAEAVNRCAAELFWANPDGVYYYPLNNDNMVQPNWLVHCVQTFASDPKIGHVGSSVWYGPSFPQMSGKIQSAGAFFKPVSGWTTRSAFVGQQTAPTGIYDVDYCGFGMYRRDLFEKFGGLCTDYPPIYWDDPDWGFTLWQNGYRVVCDPRSMIVHDHLPNPYVEHERKHHFAPIGPNKAKFMFKWQGFLHPDGTRSEKLPKVVGC